jgi:crotonobetainyl-CoA:carnitine CoA-transferase CaiB-like acyl-CoA transferase
MSDPHYAALEDIVTVPDPDLGEVRMQAVLPKFSRTPGNVRWPGGNRGAMNEEFYCGQLGLSPEELAGLQADGVV